MLDDVPGKQTRGRRQESTERGRCGGALRVDWPERWSSIRLEMETLRTT
jgi:hypothetical protein